MSKIDPSEEFMWEDTGANDNPFYAADPSRRSTRPLFAGSSAASRAMLGEFFSSGW